MQILEILWLLLFFASHAPVWSYVSSGITIVHTIEEADGEIWRVLHVPAVLYFAFQAVVLMLGFAATALGVFAWPFVVVRVIDVVFTHGILKAPGRITAPLLLIDAALVAWVAITSAHESCCEAARPEQPSYVSATVEPGSPTLLGDDWEDHHPGGDEADGFASAQRSPCWPTARARYIAGRDADGLPHDVCAVCLTRDDLNVHHIVPFAEGLRTGRPELECDPANFITLCREHHFRVGHDPDLDGPIPANWKTSNPNVRRDAARIRKNSLKRQ